MSNVSIERQLRETLHPLTAELSHRLGDQFVALVLFGSQARGEAVDTSDWDLLLLARDLPHRMFDRHLAIKRLIPSEWRGRTSILAKTPEEFEAALLPIYLDIAVDGIILHDTQMYASQHFNAIHRQLSATGLHRIRQGADMQWRWHESPAIEWSFEWEDAEI